MFVMDKKTLLFILFIFFSAACVPTTEVVELPTVAALPTITETLPATDTLTPIGTPTDTLTPNPSITITATASWTPSATITDTPSPTPTDTPIPTAIPRPVNDLIDIAMNATIITLDPNQIAAQSTMIAQTVIASGGQPANGTITFGTPSTPGAGTFGPTAGAATPSNCSFTPMGGFATIYNNNPAISSQMGCAINSAVSYGSALQNYQQGQMLWVQGPPMYIYLLYPNGSYRRMDDTWVSGVDPESGGEVPPAGLLEPVRGFGKVWRTYQDVRAAFGWATASEVGGQSSAQPFTRGIMISLPQQGQLLVLIDDGSGLVGTWQAFAGSF
jgi:hypothetical protein